jgi:hypothetical protein
LEPRAFWHNRFRAFGLSSQFQSLLHFGGQFQSLLHCGLSQEGEHLCGFATGPALFFLEHAFHAQESAFLAQLRTCFHLTLLGSMAPWCHHTKPTQDPVRTAARAARALVARSAQFAFHRFETLLPMGYELG